MSVRVQREDFDIGAEVRRLAAGRTDIGAIVTFTGTVRSDNDGSAIAGMTLEHYPGMTESELARVEAEAGKRWPLQASLIVHRVGALKPGDNIVLVVTASAHRQAAFAAAEFLMDYLKTVRPSGRRSWGPTAPSAGSRRARATTAPPSVGIRANRPFQLACRSVAAGAQPAPKLMPLPRQALQARPFFATVNAWKVVFPGQSRCDMHARGLWRSPSVALRASPLL